MLHLNSFLLACWGFIIHGRRVQRKFKNLQDDLHNFCARLLAAGHEVHVGGVPNSLAWHMHYPSSVFAKKDPAAWAMHRPIHDDSMTNVSVPCIKTRYNVKDCAESIGTPQIKTLLEACTTHERYAGVMQANSPWEEEALKEYLARYPSETGTVVAVLEKSAYLVKSPRMGLAVLKLAQGPSARPQGEQECEALVQQRLLDALKHVRASRRFSQHFPIMLAEDVWRGTTGQSCILYPYIGQFTEAQDFFEARGTAGEMIVNPPNETLRYVFKSGMLLDRQEKDTIQGDLFDSIDLLALAGVCHNDMWDANVLISQDANGRKRATIIDFGQASFEDDYGGDDLMIIVNDMLLHQSHSFWDKPHELLESLEREAASRRSIGEAKVEEIQWLAHGWTEEGMEGWTEEEMHDFFASGGKMLPVPSIGRGLIWNDSWLYKLERDDFLLVQAKMLFDGLM